MTALFSVRRLSSWLPAPMLVVLCCNDPTDAIRPVNTAGGGTAGTSGAGGASSSGGSTGGSSSGSTSSQGGSASGWELVDWAACPVLRATEPDKAVPALDWQPCEWQQGCERVKANWPVEGTQPWALPTVALHQGGHYVAADLNWSEDGQWWPRAAIYDPAGEPIAVWRATEPVADVVCSVAAPVLSPARVWIETADFDNDDRTYLVAGYDELVSPQLLPVTAASQIRQASDDLLVLFNADGWSSTVYDRVGNTVAVFGLQGKPYSYFPVQPLADSALFLCYPEGPPGVVYGCAWTRASQQIVPLIVPDTKVVPLVASDGKTLVWIETVHEPSQYAAGWFWTSPFATSPQALVPKKRRPSPPLGVPEVAAGDGYFAWSNVVTKQIEIYRLEDMQRWVIDWQPEAGAVFGIPYLDSSEIWYDGSLSLVRQKLAALGPGEPEPPQ